MARARGKKKKPKLSERELKDLETYEGLKQLIEEAGWSVTVARSLDGGGGHCLVHGEQRVIFPSRLSTLERIDVLVDALRAVDLEDRYVRPDLRTLIEGDGGADAPDDEAEAGEASSSG